MFDKPRFEDATILTKEQQNAVLSWWAQRVEDLVALGPEPEAVIIKLSKKEREEGDEWKGDDDEVTVEEEVEPLNWVAACKYAGVSFPIFDATRQRDAEFAKMVTASEVMVSEISLGHIRTAALRGNRKAALDYLKIQKSPGQMQFNLAVINNNGKPQLGERQTEMLMGKPNKEIAHALDALRPPRQIESRETTNGEE